MSETIWQYQEGQDSQTIQLKGLIEEAEAVVVGIGAGMSAATGFTYVGSRFEQAFPEFIEKYGYYDMLQAFLSEFEDWREYWAFQSRFALLNYFDQPVGQAYLDLKEILKDKTYHIITTNADNAFYAADYEMDKVFRIQGEYGLWQCSAFCHQQTYQDEDLIRRMVLEQEDLKIPEELVPYCPECGAPLEVNKRDAVRGMVEDRDWHQQNNCYQSFLDKYQDQKLLYLEIGVGHTTPQFIRQPFQKWTATNPNALYVTMNQKPYRIPGEIKAQSVRINEDISDVLSGIVELL
ncbi:NAD-dependent deacetylase [Facklamia sp. DSM 111018]|uniref:NAD-dependent deacetylase n=1 Tax=Facklamia lactis TaxID=2749967 RepID=A0ABS0LPN2_9LACT|nr:NAD-dependent deacetylase [Facklamia lactis]MBG9980295.1 NAD-dependent deacetylase [Facklamia lactis]MBG9986098.1 NAD-dependent deacetylase [Facklamia lactis]